MCRIGCVELGDALCADQTIGWVGGQVRDDPSFANVRLELNVRGLGFVVLGKVAPKKIGGLFDKGLVRINHCTGFTSCGGRRQ